MKRKGTIISLLCISCLLFTSFVYAKHSRSHRRHHRHHRRHRRRSGFSFYIGPRPYYHRRYYYYYPYPYARPPVTVYREKVYRYPRGVPTPPPERLSENTPPSPGPGYAWVPGSWAWNGQWIWMRGQWVLPPTPNSQWVPGYWKQTNKGYVRIPGRWQ